MCNSYLCGGGARAVAPSPPRCLLLMGREDYTPRLGSSSQPLLAEVKIYVDACVLSEDRAGAGVYWGPESSRNLAKRLKGSHTSLTAEIAAAVIAIEQAANFGILRVTIVTDSDAVIGHATGKRDVSASDTKIFRYWVGRLHDCLKQKQVKWELVKAHSGNPGNDAAHALAREGAQKPHDE
ncbi:unnamed protein product [Dicrocoelium dendriticum]|nr:unnamed protein product [Dicrocoelium dendriticum]